MTRGPPTLSPESLHTAFAKYDRSREGALSIEEVRRFLQDFDLVVRACEGVCIGVAHGLGASDVRDPEARHPPAHPPAGRARLELGPGLGPPCNAPFPSTTPGQAQKATTDKPKDAVILDHFISADHDKDSKLSFEEFQGLYSKVAGCAWDAPPE